MCVHLLISKCALLHGFMPKGTLIWACMHELLAICGRNGRKGQKCDTQRYETGSAPVKRSHSINPHEEITPLLTLVYMHVVSFNLTH